MSCPSAFNRQLIAGNEDEFGLHYLALRFPGQRRQRSASLHRLNLLTELAEKLSWSAGQTKPHLGVLSPGCQRCVAGSWSCLFVNGQCNASCFYCPAPQDRKDNPATNNLSFQHPQGYAAYLRRLGFRGASISGGEPLLTLNRTLAFLRAAREALGADGHLWLYTNGILLNHETAARLAAAGLDEIRFDIGATGYQCHNIAAAAGLIPTITVEIPAVPEAVPTLKRVLPEMLSLGVDYLNLHQLRLTRHNFRQLTDRNYTFLHGEKVTVLESELAALDILSYVQQHKLPLPVNYCSFVFKHRHQKAAARRRAAQLEVRPWERLTAAGYIRRIALQGSPDLLRRQLELWQRSDADTAAWNVTPDLNQLELSPELLHTVKWHRLRLAITYDLASLTSQGQAERGDWKLPLESGPAAWVTRRSASPVFLLGRSAAERFQGIWLAGKQPEPLPPGQRVFSAWESIPPGLQVYF